MIGLGVGAGYWLAHRPTFKASDVLNLVGIVYNLTGVIVLYQTFAEEDRYRRFAVAFVAPFVLWTHSLVPLGVSSSWLITRGTPHRIEVSRFGLLFFLYSLLPMSILDAAVTFPRIGRSQPIDLRYRRFGLFLLATGLGIQLIGAGMALR
jgi:hypothetical protein